ncbi:MAG: hypothetical protein WC839_01500 [Candidatus Paceibacterota bacterium]
MKDFFNSAPKINKIDNLNSQLELFKKDPDKFVNTLTKNLPNEYDAKSEIWKLLNEVGISSSDKPLGGKMPYSYYDIEKLKELLKTTIKQKEAA